jgi:hypothetical protein
MIGRNHLTARQVRNRPRQLQHPVIYPGRQVQLLHRRLQQLFPRRIRLAELAHLRRPHLRVARQLRALEAFQLAFARGLNSRSNGLGILDIALVGQFLIIDAEDFDVDVYTVQERSADLFLVAGDGHSGTTAFFHRIAIIAARAGVRTTVVGAI